MKAAIQSLLRRYYGPRCESFDPRQLLLFGQLIDTMPLDVASIEAEADGEKLVTRRAKNRHKHGRQQLPEQLERIEIEHDLSSEEKACPACGCERSRIGAEVSEQLEYFPANFKVLKHVRHKYACVKCDAEGESRTSRRPRNRRSRSKRDWPAQACWPTSSRASWETTCRCTAWKESSPGRTCKWPAARCVPG